MALSMGSSTERGRCRMPAMLLLLLMASATNVRAGLFGAGSAAICGAVNATVSAAAAANVSCGCRAVDAALAKIVCADSDRNATIAIDVNNAQLLLTCAGRAEAVDTLLASLPQLRLERLWSVSVNGCVAVRQVMTHFAFTPIYGLNLQGAAGSGMLLSQDLAGLKRVNSLTLTGYHQPAADLFTHVQPKVLAVSADGLQLPSQVFHPLRYLESLSLGAGLTRLPSDAFGTLRQLRYLSLRDNRLHQLRAEDFRGLSSLRVLILSSNGIARLPVDVFSLVTRLTTLKLDDNALGELDEELFWPLTLLEVLDLSNNRLRSLPVGVFANTTLLTKLLLSGNQLTDVDGRHFATLSKLTQIYLNDNRLSTLAPDTFAKTVALQSIFLRGNRIEMDANTTCAALEGPGSLHVVDLSNNSISRFCERLPLHSFQQLHLAGNRLSALNIAELRHLACHSAFVDLSENRIERLYFQHESTKTGAGTGTVKCKSDVRLNRNPLNCDCALLPFVLGEWRHWLGEQMKLIVDELRCAAPAHLLGKRVDVLLPTDLLCPLRGDCPPRCQCWERKSDRTLLVNCSHAQLLQVPALPPPADFHLVAVELHVEGNNITDLPLNTTIGYANASAIYAANNQLDSVAVAHLPTNLSRLDVRGNRLERLDADFLRSLNTPSYSTLELHLSRNPWLCDCDAASLLNFIKANQSRIPDLDQLFCADPWLPKLIELSILDICSVGMEAEIVLLLFVLLFGFVFSVAVALFYKYQLEIKVWLYARNLCLCCVTEQELDRDKRFDAFISYSHKDRQFVHEHLLPGLENGPTPFKVCIHVRDWLVGAFIPEQIIESVEQSRRTIIVLSQNFIESDWALMEFRTAHQCSLNEGRARIILIIYGDITDTESLYPELQAYIKMNTYLKWDDPWFWDKLRYAMPHSARTN